MSLVDNMAGVFNRIYPISDRFGIKTHITFTYKNRNTGLDTTVLPRPQANNPPVNKVYEFNARGVEVNSGDKYVTNISRTYSDVVEGSICSIDGKPYSILWIDREKTVTYNLLCRPERAR
jgi:hypothetical protein